MRVPRKLAKLSAREVATITRPGRHSDGGGLYLVVDQSGARRWVFIYRSRTPRTSGAGKLREMGLGSFLSVSLAKARQKASAAREQLDDGIDPIAAREAQSSGVSFGEVADQVLAKKEAELTNEKSKYKWRRALKHHAAAVRSLPIASIETDHVLEVLNPIWLKTPETAAKVRGQIEAVLDAGKARGLRSGDNPARWRGHLDHLLARPGKLTKGHHAALPFGEVPAFLASLRTRSAMSALALEFAILTAARSGEVLGARWGEFDLGNAIWTIPAARMKARREHRVPLSPAAAIVLNKARAMSAASSGFVFPGARAGGQLSNMSFAMLLRRMGRSDLTAHGFRSSFRDWCGEMTNHPREVAEEALAHVVGNAAERAYRRGDALEKRRRLMDEWANYCQSNGKANSQ